MSTATPTAFQTSLKPHKPAYYILGIVLVAYFLAPVAVAIPASLTTKNYLSLPTDGFTLRWFEQALSDRQWIRAFATSLQVSGLAATIGTVSAFLAVTGLARNEKLARRLRPLFFLPMVFPIVVLALGMSRALAALGETSSLFAVALGQAFLCLPVAFIALSAGMANIDSSLHRAAASMGSPWWHTVIKVDLPLLRQNLVGAFILAFAYAFDEAVLALFLAPAGNTTLPTLLFNQAKDSVSPLLASVSTLILLLTFVIAVLFLAINSIIRRRSTSKR